MVLLLVASVWSVGASEADGQKVVFIYYYAWYGSRPYDGQWMHWQDNGHLPPEDIASSFYPKLGPYSSRDLYVIDRHMRWIAGANITALIYSWWGQNDFTDHVARRVLDSAADYNLKVSFLIEPYPGRSPRGLCSDIEYLVKKYGNHPAFFQTEQKTRYGTNPAKRPMFFIYNPDFAAGEMRQVADEIHASDHDSILLVQSTDARMIDDMHADGLFAYEAVRNVMYFYKGLLQTISKQDSIFVPCVSPGFNMIRNVGKTDLFHPRLAGRTYDEWWRETVAANPHFVAIISFNEWHEGTQIEPVVSVRSFPRRYFSYQNAYGKTGIPAEQSYLRRTASWIDIFLQMLP